MLVKVEPNRKPVSLTATDAEREFNRNPEKVRTKFEEVFRKCQEMDDVELMFVADVLGWMSRKGLDQETLNYFGEKYQYVEDDKHDGLAKHTRGNDIIDKRKQVLWEIANTFRRHAKQRVQDSHLARMLTIIGLSEPKQASRAGMIDAVDLPEDMAHSAIDKLKSDGIVYAYKSGGYCQLRVDKKDNKLPAYVLKLRLNNEEMVGLYGAFEGLEDFIVAERRKNDVKADHVEEFNNEKLLKKLFNTARHLPRPEIERLIERAQKRSDHWSGDEVPKEAPELYVDRPEDEPLTFFLRRVYKARGFLQGKTNVSHFDVIDPKLAAACRSYLYARKRKTFPDDINLQVTFRKDPQAKPKPQAKLNGMKTLDHE